MMNWDLLSNSLDDMTLELQKRISHAENFSTDLVHEIRNPLHLLKVHLKFYKIQMSQNKD